MKTLVVSVSFNNKKQLSKFVRVNFLLLLLLEHVRLTLNAWRVEKAIEWFQQVLAFTKEMQCHASRWYLSQIEGLRDYASGLSRSLNRYREPRSIRWEGVHKWKQRRVGHVITE